MAPQSKSSAAKPNARRVRKRKARTEVSSSESSSSESEDEKSSSSSSSEDGIEKADQKQGKVSHQQQESFSSFYLRKVTSELADDLDKVRQSSDFNDRSLPMLIHALKQGESIFGKDEVARIVRER
ncbi:hypothetical protein AOQ84DRAFT_183401 [Glonium stellatum]|uniref:Ribosome assembly protein 3 n=1 Tax=Glonium stellatum TaxID=574774 RepID=A0A8E2F7N5_9PEZI|nr:hypothetical protein AOQ84DRAFT_183401 [Glonium stellatum]